MTEVSSFSDHDTKKFFSRIAFEKEDSSDFNLDALEEEFQKELNKFKIEGILNESILLIVKASADKSTSGY